jgi:hypothetical protein
LHAQWVNRDKSTPTMTLMMSEDINVLKGHLFITGDPTAYIAKFGTAAQVTFTFLPFAPECVPMISTSLKSGHAATRFGWYRSAVTVVFHCVQGSYPLRTKCPSNRMLRANGTHQVSGVFEDSIDEVARAHVTVKIDRTAPTVAVRGVTSGSTYRHAPSITCHATDALSGVASCTINTHRAGHVVTYTATAKDKAGNVARRRGHYTLG